MPGHSLAALLPIPSFPAPAGRLKSRRAGGVFDDVYCPEGNDIYLFEKCADGSLHPFPGKYIHIGGDECPKTRWKTCAHCQALIKRKGLKDENGLQSYFIKRIEKFFEREKGNRSSAGMKFWMAVLRRMPQ